MIQLDDDATRICRQKEKETKFLRVFIGLKKKNLNLKRKIQRIQTLCQGIRTNQIQNFVDELLQNQKEFDYLMKLHCEEKSKGKKNHEIQKIKQMNVALQTQLFRVRENIKREKNSLDTLQRQKMSTIRYNNKLKSKIDSKYEELSQIEKNRKQKNRKNKISLQRPNIDAQNNSEANFQLWMILNMNKCQKLRQLITKNIMNSIRKQQTSALQLPQICLSLTDLCQQQQKFIQKIWHSSLKC